MTLSDDAERAPSEAPLGPGATSQPVPIPARVPQAPQPDDGWPTREPLHFVVIALLLADVVFGLGLAVFAEKVIAFRPMAIMGCGLAALGLGILAYFVLMGGGKDKRRRR